MRVGHYVSVASVQKGRERNVSGHIQIPLESLRRLRDAGHYARLITNEFGEDRTLPACMPDGVGTDFVTDGRRRKGFLEGKTNAADARGVYPFRLLAQVQQIKRIVNEQKLDVLHFFGHTRTALLAGGLRLVGLRCPVVVTALVEPPPPNLFVRPVWRRIDAIVSSTDYVTKGFERAGLACTTLRHGVIRDLREELGDERPGLRNRVLYWRDPTESNGADLCAAAFDALAPEFPHYSFEFAIRPWRDEVKAIEEVAARHSNVQVHRFPYPPGMSLPKLVAESALVVLPFRKLSLDPQLAVAESLAAGSPVVTTNMRSNPELVVDGETGALAPPDDATALTEVMRRLLVNPDNLAAMGRRAAEDFRTRWNWDRYLPELLSIYERVTSRRALPERTTHDAAREVESATT
ncbi:MAG: glycosyltransferase family 4 protein [Phycisphaerales bacterium]